LPQLTKLFRVFKYGAMQNLNIFEARETSILNLQFQLNWKFEIIFLTGPGPLVSGPAGFNCAHQSLRSRCSPLTQSPCGDRPHGGERAGADHRQLSPLPLLGRTLSGRVCVVGGGYSPLPSSFMPLYLALARRYALHRRPPLSTVVADQAEEPHHRHPL
jgi:hypothetical protein